MDTPRPLRVLHVVPSYWPATAYGGPIESVHALCTALSRAGASVRVLTTDADGARRLPPGTERDREVLPGLRVAYHRRWGGVSVAPGLAASLPREISRCEIVHVTAVYSFPTIPALLAARLANRPVVWSPRGSLQTWEGTTRPRLKAAWRAVCSAVMPRRTILHVTSEAEAAASRELFPRLEVAVIPNGIDVPDVPPRPSRSGALHLVFVGRLHPIKAVENLLDACAILSNRGGSDWRLSVAGEGDPAYAALLQRRAGQAGIASQVSFLGPVHDRPKRDLLLSADLVVVPSHSENFSMVVVEALAHGVPVVASRGTPWSALPERGCGWWVANDPATLAEVLEMARGRDLREMGAIGRRWMAEEFPWHSVAARMLEAYRRLGSTAGR